MNKTLFIVDIYLTVLLIWFGHVDAINLVCLGPG